LIPSKQTQLVCREIVEVVSDYLADAMPAETCAAFEQHLHACPWCLTYLQQVRRTIALVGATPSRQPLPTEVEQRFRSMFRAWRAG